MDNEERDIIPDPSIARVCRTKSGFADIKAAADELARETPSAERLALASGLPGHDAWQVQMLATFLLGRVAADDERALAVLRDRVSVDANWRVQESLAMAFDRFCADKGYEAVCFRSSATGSAVPEPMSGARHRRACGYGQRDPTSATIPKSPLRY